MGLRCLLISTNTVVNPYPVYPLGTAHLAGALEKAGHRAILFDFLAFDGLANLRLCLQENEFDLIGVSIRNIDTVDSTAPHFFLESLAEIMACIRLCTTAPVVLGGPAFSIMPEKILALLEADYGIVGEGETLLPWLADALFANKAPESQIFHSSHDAKPLPVRYERHLADYYLRWGGMLNIQTKRGCPHRCTYCLYPSLEGKRLRCRDPREVAEDVRRLSEEFGARYLFFTDAVFNDRQGHFLQVAEALIEAGNTTPWCAFFRPDSLRKKDLELLRKAGLAAMELGTDASSDTTLAGLQKDFSFADVLQVNSLARELEIPCAHFVIFGGPGETPKTLDEGLRNIARLENMVVFGFAGIRVLPGSGVERTAVRQGVLNNRQSLFEPFFYFSPDTPFRLLDEKIKQSWAGHRQRVYPCSVMEEKVKLLHQLGHCGPMWDLLIDRKK